MAITTLLAYRIDQKAKADAAVKDAHTALTTAQTDLATQRAKLTKANQELAGLAKQTAQIRADLAEAATPADVDALESKLAKAISDTRAKQAEIIGIETAIDTAQTALELVTANVTAATTRAAAVATALEAADQDKDRVKVGDKQAIRTSNSVTISGLTGHPFIVNDAITVMEMTDAGFNGAFTVGAVTVASITYPQTAADATSGGGVVFGKRALRLRHKLAKPPLSTLVADATAALAAKPWTDAKARIEADLPQELRDCAKERAKVELQRLENDKKKVAETAKLLDAVIADVVDHRRQVFDTADAAFRDYVVNAKSRFDQALAIAARVADPKQSPLTAAENLSIHSKKPDGSLDATLEQDRKDAAAASQAVATAQIDVDAKQTDVDIARLDALTKDIDANPETDPAVMAAEGGLGTAQTKLDSAKMAFTAAMQTVLTDWETAVPDPTWRNLADFEAAKRLLLDLKTDPAPLVTAMDTAESDLVVALLAAEKAGRTLGRLESEALKAAAKARFATGSLPRRLIGALRGDS